MSKRYIFTIFILVSIIFALLLLPKVFYCSNDAESKIHYKANTCTTINPKALLLEAINAHRYISADDLTSKIVSEDPSFILVDLRDAKQFKNFTLPKAVNIPFKQVMDEKHHSLFSNDDYTVVLFSNGTVIADQVWSILRRKAYTNIMVLKGGLNDFYTQVLNPVKPKDTDSEKIHQLYNFRKAAGTYFGLPNPDEFIPELKIEPVQKINKRVVNTKKKIVVKSKLKPVIKEEEEEEEGC